MEGRAKGGRLSFSRVDSFSFRPIRSPSRRVVDGRRITRVGGTVRGLPPGYGRIFFLTGVRKLPCVGVTRVLRISMRAIGCRVTCTVRTLSGDLGVTSPGGGWSRKTQGVLCFFFPGGAAHCSGTHSVFLRGGRGGFIFSLGVSFWITAVVVRRLGGRCRFREVWPSS